MRIVLQKQIHGTFAAISSSDVWLERVIQLPFPPFVGLYIWDGEDFEAIITEIAYNLKTGDVECCTEADKEIYGAVLHRESHRPIEEIVKEYEEMGWERREK